MDTPLDERPIILNLNVTAITVAGQRRRAHGVGCFELHQQYETFEIAEQVGRPRMYGMPVKIKAHDYTFTFTGNTAGEDAVYAEILAAHARAGGSMVFEGQYGEFDGKLTLDTPQSTGTVLYDARQSSEASFNFALMFHSACCEQVVGRVLEHVIAAALRQ